jgi:hypothetical protein
VTNIKNIQPIENLSYFKLVKYQTHLKNIFWNRLHRHQPINVPTAGAQAFLIDYTQGEQVVNHHAGPVRVGVIRKFICI